METANERSERIARVTEKAWASFPMQRELLYYSSEVRDAFFEEAKRRAVTEFWSGEWCDMPRDEGEQEYWLHQFWGTYYQEILEIAQNEVEE